MLVVVVVVVVVLHTVFVVVVIILMSHTYYYSLTHTLFTIEDTQWRAYMIYWAKEAVRMNIMGKESLCTLQYFDGNRRHFSTLF